MNQLVDRDFFGRQIKIKAPERLATKGKQKRFIDVFKHLKAQLIIMNSHTIPTKQLKELLTASYFNGAPLNLLEEIKSPQSVIMVSELISRYKKNHLRNLQHKSKHLNIKYIETFEHFLETHKDLDNIHALSTSFANTFTEWRYRTRLGNSSKNKPISDATISKEWGELRRCFEWHSAQGDHCLELNIFKSSYKLPLTGVKKAITPLGIEAQLELLECLRQESPFFHDCILFLLSTGIRRGELNTLSPSSFDLESECIQINSISIGNSIRSGKTEAAPRIIPLSNTCRNLLERKHIFNENSKVATSNRLSNYVSRKRATDSLFKNFNLHILRHSYITNILQAGKYPLVEVSKIVGHKSISLTSDRYGKYASFGSEKMKQKYSQHLNFLEVNYFS